MSTPRAGPLNVFVSYAHEDNELCRLLLKHLSQLQREGVQGWYDRRITGGTEWAGEIDQHLNTADIILLLISPDFLASRYCYDVEMERAMERHDQDQARVVPVILRPCDWKTSPFGKFNALPRDGRPVVDWKTRDHGFLNVVEGLRRVVAELGTRAAVPRAAPEGVRPAFRAFPESHPLRWVALAVLLVPAAWFWWGKQQQCVVQGDALLDIGRYAEARQQFQRALQWNPLRARASRGLDTAKLYDLMSKPVEFEQQLNRLSKQAPNDAHLKVLEGDYELAQGRANEALRDYQAAADVNPRVAEAHFRLCVLYDMRRNSGRALQACQKAVDLSPLSPHYRANLAGQYFKHGEYRQAIHEYMQVVDGYPLAKLEMAIIQRLQGDLDDAREAEQMAIEELESDTAMASLPENSLPWIFEVPANQAVSIPSKDQKLCYAHLELSATLYLAGNESQAIEHADRAARACRFQTRDIKAVLDWELARVADERNELAPKVYAYRRRVQATWGTLSR
ncbi:MAG: toll/interleukin-1 receptor domain-containing protein [Acidobacteriia bacterium]|nr:toll/interleukin-1 receptor domain-containing protein [Terriglobia bacterium]